MLSVLFSHVCHVYSLTRLPLASVFNEGHGLPRRAEFIDQTHSSAKLMVLAHWQSLHVHKDIKMNSEGADILYLCKT